MIDPAAIFAAFAELTRVERAPCADGVHHTTYMLVATEADHVAPFPAYNFAITSAEHQAEVRRVLAERGLSLDLSEMSDDDDELLGFDEDGRPKPMTLANAIQVWSLQQGPGMTVADCAAVFRVSEIEVRAAIAIHPWMFTTGPADEFVEHEGE